MTPSAPTSAGLRIALDGYNFAMPKGTGVANYGFTLAQMLQQMGHQVEGIFGIDVGRDPAIRETLLYDAIGREQVEHRKQRRARQRKEKIRALTGVKMQEVQINGIIENSGLSGRIPSFTKIWSAANLFESARFHFQYFGRFMKINVNNPPDIVHWTYPVPIHLNGARNIYTVHDIVPLKMPYTTLDSKRYYYNLLKECINTADMICTVSESSKRDIVNFFDFDSKRIFNSFQSSPIPDELINSCDDDEFIIKSLFSVVPKDYFIFFGAVDPKKNLARIIEAYTTSQALSPLILVTARDWGMAGTQNVSGKLELHGHLIEDGRIKRIDYLPRPLLFRLIRNAKAVLLPSLYEGFGLPALEAILTGTPVIGSNTGSLPEVIGDAGLLVDPYSVQDIRAAIERMDSDDELRTRLVNSGKIQADKFSNDNYQQRLAQLYAAVLAQ